MTEPEKKAEHYRRSLLRRLARLPLWVLDLLETFSTYLERVAGSAWRRSGEAVGNSFGQADTVLARLARASVFPFRVVGRSVEGLFRLLNIRHWGPVLVRWTRPLFYPFLAVGNFLGVLLSTRPRTVILWSLPLLVVVGPILYLLIRGMVVDQQVIANRYRRAVIEAVENRDLDRAELFEKKLIQLGVASERYDFDVALRLEKDGQLEAAFQKMKGLAPEDRPGLAAAHFWLARNLLDGKLPVDEKESLRLTEIHLQHARTVGRDAPEFEYLFAVLEIKQGKVDSALRRIDRIQGQLLAAAILKLEVCLELDRMADAKSVSASLLRLINAEQGFELLADANLYRTWAAAERLAGTREGLAAVLEKWNKKFPEDAGIRTERATVRIEQLERDFRPGTRIDVAQTTLRFLEVGQMVDPAERGRLAVLLHQLDSRRTSEPDVAQVLQNLELSDQTPGIILEHFGTSAIVRSDFAVGRKFLDKAVVRNPDDFVAWNNLAFLLNTQFADDKQSALTAANNAVRLAPDNIQARETRGMILIRMERWQEAITDLEIALNGLPGSAEIHRALGTAYRKTGNELLADSHIRQAKE